NLDLQNVGTANSGNVTATLQATGGVINPSATQNYGSLIANGSAVTRPFTFTVSPSVACGSTITLTFLIQDGTNSFNFTKTFATGTPVTSLTQNFDGVTAPALPAGWVSTASGANTGWVTSTTSPNSAPNSAFSADPNAVGDGQLETPSISINSASSV